MLLKFHYLEVPLYITTLCTFHLPSLLAFLGVVLISNQYLGKYSPFYIQIFLKITKDYNRHRSIFVIPLVALDSILYQASDISGDTVIVVWPPSWINYMWHTFCAYENNLHKQLPLNGIKCVLCCCNKTDC